MHFNLNFQPKVSINKINYESKVLCIGSCFTENIGAKLNQHKFNVSVNPFGIVFNPLSIINSIHTILDKTYYSESSFIKSNDSFTSYDIHSSLNNTSSQELQFHLNGIIDEWHHKLSEADYLCLTFGSGYYYKLLQTNNVVANCHKQPNTLFSKHLIDFNEANEQFNLLITKLKQFNPKLKLIFSVSPVKHIKDGVVENSLSKAMLIHLAHQLINQQSNCEYFPAYELITDDLRDYRFYKEDLVHPSQQAIEYVWQHFMRVYFSDDTKKQLQLIEEILKAIQHKPFNAEGLEYQKFKTHYLNLCHKMMLENKTVNLNSEISFFNN